MNGYQLLDFTRETSKGSKAGDDVDHANFVWLVLLDIFDIRHSKMAGVNGDT